ncbi:hypothetical protein [Nocardia sp. NPDC049526]|uniref:hypothetical protein n=1 Tax=Nocardia sp. NPDC049526 TaxID=3364316 RepID=UPI0037BBFB7A
MRFVKTGVLAVALAGALMTGAGIAHADESITVDATLLGCAMQAGISASDLTEANIGRSITVSDEVAAQLRAKGCL